MRLISIGVADCKISGQKDAVLVTYALGSCIAVMLHDPVARVGGMLHYMLPSSSLDTAQAERNPFMFADTGLSCLLQDCLRAGADPRRLRVAAVGGAQVLDLQDAFSVGKDNYVALRENLALWRLPLHAEDIGGKVSRTVRLEILTGRVLLRKGEQPEPELRVRPSLRPISFALRK